MIPWWWIIVCLWVGVAIGVLFRGLMEISAQEDEKAEKAHKHMLGR